VYIWTWVRMNAEFKLTGGGTTGHTTYPGKKSTSYEMTLGTYHQAFEGVCTLGWCDSLSAPSPAYGNDPC
jgi:hypothetical protein